uniref:HAUS augmin like complex subunit 5 n=1 Tax=Equus caballus TaxID=9796 RepID=A0A9L0RXE6_HORSE
MALAQEARQLGCWVAEEMEAPLAARVPESTLRRLCLGQGADIWTYILRHVHSQRSVQKIRGNLLWYGHQGSPETWLWSRPCRAYKIPSVVLSSSGPKLGPCEDSSVGSRIPHSGCRISSGACRT